MNAVLLAVVFRCGIFVADGLLVFSLVVACLAVLGFSSIVAIFLFLGFVIIISSNARRRKTTFSPSCQYSTNTPFLSNLLPPLLDTKMFHFLPICLIMLSSSHPASWMSQYDPCHPTYQSINIWSVHQGAHHFSSSSSALIMMASSPWSTLPCPQK